MAGSGLGLTRVGTIPNPGTTRYWQGFHPNSQRSRPGLDPGKTRVKSVEEPAKGRRRGAGVVNMIPSPLSPNREKAPRKLFSKNTCI